MKGRWRADKRKPFEDATGRTSATAIDSTVPCGYALWELTAEGTFFLVSNHCTGNCSAVAPAPSDDEMPAGLQISTPCAHF
jgi:hypothetical protein